MKADVNYIEQGEEIVLLRRTMKVKAQYIAECLGQEKGNYSRMERGFANNSKALQLVRYMYKDWVENEILMMTERIEELKQLIK